MKTEGPELAPLRPGHAPGWTWRKDVAGKVARPWAWSEINGGTDLPPHVDGLCELGWHNDCPQAPLLVVVDGCCSCLCRQGVEGDGHEKDTGAGTDPASARKAE